MVWKGERRDGDIKNLFEQFLPSSYPPPHGCRWLLANAFAFSPYKALRFGALHCIVLRCITQRHTAYCIVVLHCIAKSGALSKGHCKIFSSFFYKCILQGAIDFAEVRERSWSSGANGGAECSTFFGVAGFALSLTFSRLLCANPASHLAAHRANFLAGAICLILRSCGCGREAAKLECVEYPPYHIVAHQAAFSAMHLRTAIDFAEVRMRS